MLKVKHSISIAIPLTALLKSCGSNLELAKRELKTIANQAPEKLHGW